MEKQGVLLRSLGLRLSLAITAVALGIGSGSQAVGAGFIVNSTFDQTDGSPGDGTCETAADNGMCTLRAAIDETNALPGADTIVMPAGVYTITIPGDMFEDPGGDFEIRSDLTISGAGASATIVDGGGLDRVFEIIGVTVRLSDLTVTNGRAPSGFAAGGINNLGRLILERVIVTRNIAPGLGAGGGIASFGEVVMTDSVVSDNEAGQGGGFFGGALTISQSTISGNTATYFGGGIMSGIVKMTDSTVEGNSAQGGPGGGIYTESQATSSNRIELVRTTVTANYASGDGGGIGTFGGEIILTDSILSSNTSRGDGGAVRNGGIAYDICFDETAPQECNVFLGMLSATNVTFSDNAAGGRGGGVYSVGVNSPGCPPTCGDLAAVSLNNVTLSGNTAAGGGVSLFNDELSTITAANTIVSSQDDGNCGGAIISAGHNQSNDGSCGLTGPGDVQNADPLLGSLAGNGAAMQTHALLAGSPAIDAGDNASCAAADQRGVARPVDGNSDGVAVCDIGAYEAAAGTTPPMATPTPVATPPPAPTGGQTVAPAATPAGFSRSGGPPGSASFAWPSLASGVAGMVAAVLTVGAISQRRRRCR